MDLKQLFYAYKGGDKPKKAKVVQSKSPFDKTTGATFTTDFGTGASTREVYTDPATGKKYNRLATSSSLSPGLKESADLATTGLASNMGWLGKNPEEQIGFVTGGQDPFYNTLKLQNDNQLATAIGNARLQGQRTGNLNSTALGARLGAIDNENILRNNQILLSALGYNTDNARANANSNLQTIGGLNQITSPLASAANSTFMTALNQVQNNNQTNAAAQNAAEMQYAQAMNAYNQQKAAGASQLLGSGIGAAVSLGLAPFTGGTSLAGVGGLLAGLFKSSGNTGSFSGYPSNSPLSANSLMSRAGSNLGGYNLPMVY